MLDRMLVVAVHVRTEGKQLEEVARYPATAVGLLLSQTRMTTDANTSHLDVAEIHRCYTASKKAPYADPVTAKTTPSLETQSVHS